MSPMPQPVSTAGEEFASHSNSQPTKQHRASNARRLSGRPSRHDSKASWNSQSGYSLDPKSDAIVPEANTAESVNRQSHGRSRHQAPPQLVSQILHWFHEEKAKHHRKLRSKAKDHTSHSNEYMLETLGDSDLAKGLKEHRRRDSDASSSGLALEKLEQILLENMVLDQDHRKTPSKEHRDSYFPRKRPSCRSKKSSFALSSDTEYQDGDAIVPSADVVLDNSKTMSYSGGLATSQEDLSTSKKRAAKEKDAWLNFKGEIVRLIHTLRLKGWRRVPLDRGGDINVERLCGALTNAVYVVSPPDNLLSTPIGGGDSSAAHSSPRLPP